MNLSNVNIDITNLGVSVIDISEVEKQMAVVIPKIYKEFLIQSNGLVTKEGMTLYGTEDIMKRNETYEVGEYAVGYIAIGDNGAGTVFLMLEYLEAREVMAVDAGDINAMNATIVTNDFAVWMNQGLKY